MTTVCVVRVLNHTSLQDQSRLNKTGRGGHREKKRKERRQAGRQAGINKAERQY